MEFESNPWVNLLKSAQKTSLVQDGKQKIHYTFTDGSEMVEEYDMRNYDLLVRKLKKKDQLKSVGKWECEVGQDWSTQSNIEVEGISESAGNPVCIRVDTRHSFEWRIRNLPYCLETYNIIVDQSGRAIVIRTTNKKYYKRIYIPDMDRFQLPFNPPSLQFAHANNTLIIKYQKPEELLQFEQTVRAELAKVKSTGEGDVQLCNPS